ncbi:LSM domain containing protein [Babesia divergens]|uniref:LSM domain containing protein n=1 Tax=Babesia divergens TaxID=32595 RepID=A0AAD9GFY5_BABDI|nr:LSM domain containing protein [Babesia divergens]
MDMIRLNLDETIYIKCKGGREIVGRLHAYDEHCNMVLSNAKETITTVVVNPDTKEEETKVTNRDSGTVFVRGDALILLSHAEAI